MAFLSASTFPLHSHRSIKNFPKISSHKIIIINTNLNNNIHLSNNINFIKFPKSSIIQPITPNLLKPTILLPQLHTTHQKISTLLTKSALKLLLGSLIFLGSLNCRTAYATTVQSGAHLEKEEEARETQIENVEEEEEMYEKMVAQEPRNVEVLKVLVNMKMKRGKTKEGVKYVEKLIEIEPDEVEWRLLQALCYEMMGELTKAKRCFKDILRETPLLLRALHGLAMVMHKNREGPAVFDYLDQALKLAQRKKRVTEERNIKILIAQMHLVKGNLDEASDRYQELINENPRDFRPYLCQGIVYSLQDRKKEADEQFEIYRNLVPEEFPQRGFLEDVVLAAKTESREQLEKDIKAQFSDKR